MGGNKTKKFVLDPTKVKAPRPRRQQQPCRTEMAAFLMCTKMNDFDDANCGREILALEMCNKALMAVKKKTLHKPTTNYHLQRLARAALRAR